LKARARGFPFIDRRDALDDFARRRRNDGAPAGAPCLHFVANVRFPFNAIDPFFREVVCFGDGFFYLLTDFFTTRRRLSFLVREQMILTS